MSDVPKNAVILAAGMGMRLRPLTWVLPKPMLPLWGKPLIEHTVSRLESWGVRKIAVNLHWMPAVIERHLRTRVGPAAFTFFHEQAILGTGGALRPMRAFLGNDPFWLVNADIAFSVAPEPLLRAFKRSGGWGAAWLDPRRGPRTVKTDTRGRIVNYTCAVPGARGTATFCGLQLLSPELLEHLPPDPPLACSIVTAHVRALGHGRAVVGIKVPGSYWSDAGSLRTYLATHADVKRRALSGLSGGELYDSALDHAPARGRSFCCLAQTARMAPGVSGRAIVLWPGTTLGGGRTKLVRSVVAGAAWPRSGHDLAVVPATAPHEPALLPAVAALGWTPDRTSAGWMGERGSNRRFWRLANGRDTAILICYSRERPENARYASHARLLDAAGVPVPRVLADLPAEQALVLEDWGDCSLETRLRRSPDRAARYYEPVLAAALRLHTTATAKALEQKTGMEAGFDASVYRWEHELFAKHLVLGWMGRAELPAGAGAELAAVAARLQPAPCVVVHRDLQSSNVLCRGRHVALIDFQGMRLGPAAYDLASLLYDPYIHLAHETRLALLRQYADQAPDGDAVAALFPWAAVQRLTQALGAYGRLCSMGLASYAAFILPAAERLKETAEDCGLNSLAALAAEISRTAPRARRAS